MPGLRKIDKDLQGDQSSNKGRTGVVFSAEVVSPPRWRSDATCPGPEEADIDLQPREFDGKPLKQWYFPFDASN